MWVLLAATMNCNMRCTYCAVSQPWYTGHDFDFTRIDELVEEMVAARLVCVQMMTFCGLNGNFYSWFHLSTKMYQRHLEILGFEVASIRKSAYRCNHADLTGGGEVWTIVAKRKGPTLGRV